MIHFGDSFRRVKKTGGAYFRHCTTIIGIESLQGWRDNFTFLFYSNHFQIVSHKGTKGTKVCISLLCALCAFVRGK